MARDFLHVSVVQHADYLSNTPPCKFRNIFAVLFFSLCACATHADPMRILGIGNSFTVDALEQHFQPILDAQGVDAIIGYPYRGGTWLSQHDAWSTRTDTMPYNYRKFTHGQYTTTGLNTYNLTMAMADEPWDWVIIQSDHDSAGICQSYVPYMEHLINFVHTHCTNPNVKIGFYMTWAYDSASTYSAFKYYGKNQQRMYDSIINAAQMVMANHPELELLIPAGTAVQNARTSYIGQHLNRDGYHLHYDHGRYIASLCWYEKIFGESALNVAYKPDNITAYCANMCKAAAHNAVLLPYAVTDLSGEYSEPEHDPIEPGTESHLKKLIVNGMNIPLTEDDTAYAAMVDYTLSPIAMYAIPIDGNSELNITDVNGSDVERDVSRPWYYPLVTPALGQSVTYTIRVISEAQGSDETIYTLTLTGVAANNITYPISSREDMENFAAAVNAGSYTINGELTADVNMNLTKQECWMTPIGTDAHPWTGTFDGKGHTLSGFNIYSVDNDLLNLKYVGLFGCIRNATIRNLHITGTEESYFNRPSSGTNNTGNCAYGILCGCMEASTILDCSVSVPIFTNVNGHVGMICGKNADVSTAAQSLIERCYAQGTWRIRHTGIYAGILGYGYNCIIRNCYSTCTMALQQDKSARIGGILGYVNASTGRSVTVQNCHFYGSITPFDGATQTSYLGAIAGVFNGTAVTAVNCWYLSGSAPAIFGQQKNNTQSASFATATQFANGTVATALGDAWQQGTKYPVLIAPTIVTALESAIVDKVQPCKLIHNGQLLIIRDGQTYDLQGHLIHNIY